MEEEKPEYTMKDRGRKMRLFLIIIAIDNIVLLRKELSRSPQKQSEIQIMMDSCVPYPILDSGEDPPVYLTAPSLPGSIEL